MGCNSRGISLTTSMGKVMADLVLGKPTDNMPLPVETLKGMPLHSLLTKLSLYALLYFRANDFKDRVFRAGSD